MKYYFAFRLSYFYKKKSSTLSGNTLEEIADQKAGIIKNLDYNYNFIRIIILFFVNFFTFLESYLIIYDLGFSGYTDLVYLSTILLLDLYNFLNKMVYKETLKIFCKATYAKKYTKLKNLDGLDGNEKDEEIVDDNNEENEEEEDARTNSF